MLDLLPRMKTPVSSRRPLSQERMCASSRRGGRERGRGREGAAQKIERKEECNVFAQPSAREKWKRAGEEHAKELHIKKSAKCSHNPVDSKCGKYRDIYVS